MEKDLNLQMEQKAQEADEEKDSRGVFAEKEMRSRMYSGAPFSGSAPSHVFRVPEHISREYKD